MATAALDIETWDDGDFEVDDTPLRTASTATSVLSLPQSQRRDSSSRLSVRSDSNQGDEHWDVLVDEQSSIKDAVTIAKSKGIPLPPNVPRSALEGGTIRRLGGKAIKRAIADDWSEDLDFSATHGQLKLAKLEERDLSENLRQISAAFRSSPKSPEDKFVLDTIRSPKSRLAPTPISLDQFRDAEDDDEDFADVPTIKVAKHRSPQKLGAVKSAAVAPDMEDIEEDLELPMDGRLRLSTRKPAPRTPQQGDEFDLEWAEGSLGTRRAGTRRGGKSNRSSSASALSPSVSSAFTAESEDEGLDGLVLPQGPVDFNRILKKKQEQEKENLAPEPSKPQNQQTAPESDDWLEDFVVPNGKVFDDAKLTLNRNIKQRFQRPTSPGKIKATTLNFTSSKSQGAISRLPRFPSDRSERPRSHLEPVSETGAPIQRYQRPNSRLGHSAQSSISNIPAPTTPTPSTPSRRELKTTTSRQDMRFQPPTTTNAQLLRAKRSMPVMAALSSPTRSTFQRPPSRQDGTGSRLRPRSPERSESRLGGERKPFLPAGASSSQSQHVSIKPNTTRNSRRTNSDDSAESMTAAQRSLSRLAGLRPDTPGKTKSVYTAAELASQAKKTMSKPLRRRNWGDGSELELFDDLPTSATTEAKYTKQPIGRGAPRSLRSRLGHNPFAASNTSLVSARSGSETPIPITPQSPAPPKQDFPTASATTTQTNLPRFARDTAASRNAREQRQISTAFHNVRGEPLQPISANWKTYSNLSTTNLTKPTNSVKSKKKIQQKPHLIKPLGDHHREKEEKGMYYNPVLCRWEGNENALAPFDVPDFQPLVSSPTITNKMTPTKTGSNANNTGSPSGKANVALIMNVGGSNGVQLVNGMVFDPRQMRWLKVAEGENGMGLRSGGGGSSVQLEEEEDVFAGLEDLKEEDDESSVALSARHERVRNDSLGAKAQQDKSTQDTIKAGLEHVNIGDEDDHDASGHSSDEWAGPVVAEEFDVGPEFVRRQRSEEERWRRKVGKWLRSEEEVAAEEAEGPSGWRWALRTLVLNS